MIFPDGHWSSHFQSLMSCLVMFSSMKTFTLGNPFGELFSTVNDILGFQSKITLNLPRIVAVWLSLAHVTVP